MVKLFVPHKSPVIEMVVRFGGTVGACCALLLTLTFGAAAQEIGSGTRNLEVLGRAEGATYTAVAFDQSAERPLIYTAGPAGWSVLDVTDPGAPGVVAEVTAAHPVSDIVHLQTGGQTYVALSEGSTVRLFNVTGAGSGMAPEPVVSIESRAPATLFAYRHSDGRSLLIVCAGEDAMVFDTRHLIDGQTGSVAAIATPEQPDPDANGFERAYAAYHADTETDRFYGAGAGGYHVFDITDTDSVAYLTSATPAAVRRGHMVSATPDGRYILAGAEYRAAPLRIFDMQPALDGQLSVVRTSDGAWTHDWTSFLLAHETRWPLVFVAAGEAGFQVFNMRDPQQPYTYAYLQTSAAPAGSIDDRPAEVAGAVDVDVRNSDGMIAVADKQTGLWLIRLESFQNWDGRGYGLPNISSVQHWINGPSGSTSY